MAKYTFEISRLRPSGFARNDREMTLEMTSPATKTAKNVDEKGYFDNPDEPFEF